jgi:hypothetical protein
MILMGVKIVVALCASSIAPLNGTVGKNEEENYTYTERGGKRKKRGRKKKAKKNAKGEKFEKKGDV